MWRLATQANEAQRKVDEVGEAMASWSVFVAFSGLFLRRDEEREELRVSVVCLVEMGWGRGRVSGREMGSVRPMYTCSRRCVQAGLGLVHVMRRHVLPNLLPYHGIGLDAAADGGDDDDHDCGGGDNDDDDDEKLVAVVIWW